MRDKFTLRYLYQRVRHSDAVDWLFGALFLSVGLVIALGLYILLNGEPKKFNAISYASPAMVIQEDNTVPQVNGNLPAPSINLGDDIPVRLSRVITCDTEECPSGAIPVLVNVSWQQLRLSQANTDGEGSFPILVDFEAQLQEGSDYVVGDFSFVVNDLAPFAFPDAVKSYILESGEDVTVWRIEGTTTPLIGNADPVGWSTEPIHIQTSQEEE